MSSETSSEGNDSASVSPSTRSEEHTEKKLTSRYRGVCWNRKNKRWQAAINHAGKYIYLGSFLNQEEAAKAFDRAAVKLRGMHAKLNFAFADYPAEMQWNKWLVQTDDATAQVLNNPKWLRDRSPMPQEMVQTYLGHPFCTPPFPNPCTFNFPVHPIDLAGHVSLSTHQEPMHGRVIGTQGPQLMHSRPAESLYYYPHTAEMSMPATTSLFMTSENGMLSTSSPHVSASFHLSGPAIKPDPIPQTLLAGGRNFPLASLPDGAEVTNVYHGPENAFAISFVRSKAAREEVLLYDGRSMLEVGSFSSREDAAQTCQSLLKILERKVTLADATPFTGASLHSPSARHEVPESDQEAVYVDELKDRSPFEIPPGSRPSFGSEDTIEERLRIPQKFDRPTIEIALTGHKEGNKSAPLGLKSGSLKQRMGSLLQLDASLSVGNLDDLAPQTPSSHPGECKSGASVKVLSNFSLFSSGSLKNLVTGFQSLNYSIVKREDDEDEAFMVASIPSSDPVFSVAQDRISSVEMPIVCALEGSVHPNAPLNPVMLMNERSNSGLPFGKRKADEMTIQNQASKKYREANASKPQ